LTLATIICTIGLTGLFGWVVLDAVRDLAERAILGCTAALIAGWCGWCSHFGWPEGPPEPVAGVFDPRQNQYGSIDRHWGMSAPSYWARDGFRVACAQCPDGDPHVLCWKFGMVDVQKADAVAACARGYW
jgi:hypothetical protein